MGGSYPDRRGRGAGGRKRAEVDAVREWLLVAAVVGCTAVADLLQSREMKHLGFTPSRMATRLPLALSIVFLGFSFFSFLTLLQTADLSFAVPATASSFIVETLLAKYVLGEGVTARRWAGAAMAACGVTLLAL
jgi:drug/metabolite transporter (DMT)-like permease